MLRPYTNLNRHTINSKIAAEIRLHQHAHGPATPFFRQLATRRPDPTLPSKRHSAPPRAHRTLRHRAVGGAANRTQDVRLRDWPRANVVQEAVVRLTHYGICRPDVLVAGKAQQPGQHRIGRARHTQRAGQHDRRFQLAELIHLRRPCELSKSVPDHDCGRNLLAERIATVWQNRGDPRVDRVTARNRRVADANAGDVGDGVERAGRYGPYDDADVAGTGTLRLRAERGGD